MKRSSIWKTLSITVIDMYLLRTNMRVAVLKFCHDMKLEHIKTMQKHQETDEVFVLLNGSCTLFLEGAGELPDCITAVEMKPHMLYNIKKGVWHNHIMEEPGEVLIVENQNTGEEAQMKIKTRIIGIYITVLVLSFLLTFGTLSVINQGFREKEIGNAGVQTVSALAGNLSFIFANVTQFSDLIYFDDNVQNALNRVETQNIDADIHRTITKSLVNMILSGDYISSAFVFDKFYNPYSSYKTGPILVESDRILQTEWYRQMKKAGGGGFFIHGSEGVINYPTRQNKNYISYIREIGNKDTYEPIAILLLTMDAGTIQSYFENVGGDYDSRFFIVDSDGEYIIPPSEGETVRDAWLREAQNSEGYEVMEDGASKVILVSREMGIRDWRLVGCFRMNSAGTLTPYYTSTVILIMCVNLISVFICSMFLTKMIFAPLSGI